MDVKCSICGGKGEYITHSDTFDCDYPVKCQDCNGTGKITKSQAGYFASLKRKRKQKNI